MLVKYVGTLFILIFVDTKINIKRGITTLATASVDRDSVRVPHAKLRFTLTQRKNRLLADLLVGKEGLEPSSLAALVPKTSVSTNCTTYPIKDRIT